jgi:stage III sporulation protein AC
MLILKIAGLGFLVMVIVTMLKQAGRDDMGQMVSLVGVLTVLVLVIRLVSDLFTVASTLLMNR